MLKNKITKVIESNQKNKIAHQEEKNSSTWMRIILCGLFLLCVMIFQVIKMPDGMWKTAFIIVEGILGLYFWVKLIKNPILNIRKMESEVETIAELYQSVAEKEKQLSLQNKQLKNDNKVLLESEKRWKELAFFDGLTKLPNRKMIIQELTFLCEQVEDEKNHFAVVFIDLDNFKKINDSSGHHAGDKLLKVIGEKLKLLIHPEDMIGRLGGDEFALLIRRSMDKKEIIIYIENIKSVLLEIFKAEAREYNISASFGVALYPEDSDHSKELLRYADLAMYQAKENGKNQVCFFKSEMRQKLVEKITFEKELFLSLQNDEIYLEFYPQYGSEEKELRGFEVLTRWNSKNLGEIGPVKFIPIAEETGFMVILGEWILRTACLKCKKMQDLYPKEITFAINISVAQLMEPSFLKTVKQIIEETGVKAENLEFEITESVFIPSMKYVATILDELRELGIRIALDDFGTGYSSFLYLKELPIDTIKLDKTFIDTIHQPPIEKQIVASIILMAHQMGIQVVAEGVENQNQLEYLKQYKCDSIQGQLWGASMTELQMHGLLRALFN